MVTSLNILYVTVQCCECVCVRNDTCFDKHPQDGFYLLRNKKESAVVEKGHLMLMPQDDLDSKEDSQMPQIPCLEE